VPDRAPNWKMLNRPKEMNAVSTEVLLRFFSSCLPICPVFFHLVMPRHVYGTCYAHFEHTRGYKKVCNILLGMLCEVRSAKHAWDSLEKIWIGQRAD
jgi:hypothetical protein